MNKLIPIFVALSFGAASVNIMAAPSEDMPPAQMQKDKVPDSTSNGNYLETQPDENGANKATTETDKHHKKSKDAKKHSKTKPAIKGKQTTEEPADGGMELESK